jgi:hypothetical protein
VIYYVSLHECVLGSGGRVRRIVVNAVLDDYDLSAARTGRLNPGDRAFCTLWRGDLLVARAGLRVCED